MANLLAYVRASQGPKQRNTIAVQQSQIETFAELRGHRIRKTFIGDGESGHGGIDKRAEFRRVLVALESDPGLDGLAVADLSRLTRDIGDAAMIRDVFTPPGGKMLLAVNDLIDLSSPSGVLLFNIRVSVFEFERAECIRRVKVTLADKAARGERTSGKPPYGFDFDPADPSKVIPNDDEQSIIKRMRAEFEDGKTLTAIAAGLNADGIPSKMGKTFDHRAVGRVLEREGVKKKRKRRKFVRA